MKKIILALVIFILFLCGLWIAANFAHLRAFPGIISAFYAKEFCSCYFVTERSKQECHNYARQYIPITDFRIEESDKRIVVSGLGVTNSAIYNGLRKGCLIENR